MIRKRRLVLNFELLICLIFFNTYLGYSQKKVIIDSLYTNKVFHLDEVYVLNLSSIALKYKNKRLAINEDYKYDSFKNEITLLKTISIGVDTLHVNYSVYPVKKLYSLYDKPRPLLSVFTKDTSSAYIVGSNRKQWNESLNTSGVFFRGFRITTNQKMSLESGMNLRVDGFLNDDIQIKSVLTDEKTPIQPEGTTRYISDLDKIFIQLNAPYANVTLGDFNFKQRDDLLFNYSNRLQGLKIKQTGKHVNTSASFASVRGRNHRYRFITKEGLQGPYQLLGANLERDILLIAGSERVFLDNKELIRGDRNDYVIEYGSSTLTFTSNNHISANSEVVVDFEYVSSDQRFGKNLQRYTIDYSDKKSNFSFQFIEEKDNINTPLSEKETYTDEEKVLLKEAGDDPALTEISTIVKNKFGSYEYTYDTFSSDSVLIYNPGSLNEKYNATFTYVGEYKGRYKRISRFKNEYKYVGHKNGNFEPVKRLSLPKKQFILVGKGEYIISEEHSVQTRVAQSVYDKNSLSAINDSDNNGFFGSFDYRFNGELFSKLVESSVKYIIHEKTFKYLQPIQNSSYNSGWNLSLLPEFGTRNELQSVTQIKLSEKTKNDLNYSYITESDSIRSYKLENKFSYNSEKWNVNTSFLHLNLENEHIKLAENYSNARFESKYKGHTFEPFVDTRYERRNYQLNQTNSYSTLNNSFGFKALNDRKDYLSYSYTLNHLFLGDTTASEINDLERIDRSLFSVNQTHKIESHFSSKTISDELSFSYRVNDVTSFYERLNSEERTIFYPIQYLNPEFEDTKSLLFRHRFKFSPKNKGVFFKLNYELANEQTALKEVVYREVTKGFGQFRRDSINNIYVRDDVAGNFVQFILPTGEFEPVTRIKSAIDFSFFPKNYKLDLLEKFQLKAFLKLNEETKDSFSLGQLFLSPGSFFSSKTQSGSIVSRNYVYYDRANPDFSVRYGFRSSRGLFRTFVSDNEGRNRRNKESVHDLKFKYRFMKNITFIDEMDIKQLKIESNNSLFDRNIFAYGLSHIINYNFTQRTNLTMKLLSRYETNESDQPVSLLLNGLEMNSNIVLKNDFYFRLGFDVYNVKQKQGFTGQFIPYELVNGNRPGINKKWTLSGSYQIYKNTSLTLNYTGRKNVTDIDTFHFGRLEFRMVF